jgi:hypothetical protein
MNSNEQRGVTCAAKSAILLLPASSIFTEGIVCRPWENRASFALFVGDPNRHVVRQRFERRASTILLLPSRRGDWAAGDFHQSHSRGFPRRRRSAARCLRRRLPMAPRVPALRRPLIAALKLPHLIHDGHDLLVSRPRPMAGAKKHQRTARDERRRLQSSALLATSSKKGMRRGLIHNGFCRPSQVRANTSPTLDRRCRVAETEVPSARNLPRAW